MSNKLSGKVAFITGANKGIGLETARGLGKLGVAVVIGSRDEARGQAAAVTLPSSEAHPKEPPVQVPDASLGEKLVREYRDLKDSRSRVLLAKDRWLSAAARLAS